jgi:hypothetical protein
MKKFLVLLLISLGAIGQELKIDPHTNAISYVEIVQADSMGAVQLLKLSRKWAVTVFGAGKEMIEYYDENDSTLILKPAISITTKLSMPVGYAIKEIINNYSFRYKLEIETKKGRYRVIADDFKGETKGPNGEMYPVESIFFDEEKVTASMEAMREKLPKSALKYMPKIRIEDMKQERLDLQSQLDAHVRSTYESLKRYINTRPKRDW